MKLATLCYVQQQNLTLMMQRNANKDDIHFGKWNGLGGKLEQHESPEECVIREVKEESGLNIIQPKLAGILTFPKFAKHEDWYAFVFTANNFNGNLEINSNEGTLEWIETDKILKLNLWEGDKIFLPWVFKGDFFSAKFEYENNKLIKHSVSFYKI